MTDARNGFLLLGGLASIGAGALHLFAAGLHTEHATLARLMVALAALQCVTGLLATLGARRAVTAAVLGVNLFAAATWAYTRFASVPWIDGLEAEAPQFIDSVCAALGVLAAVAAGVALTRPQAQLPAMQTGIAATAVGVLAVAAMLGGVGHVHSHGDDHAHGDQAAHGDDHAHGDQGAHGDHTGHSAGAQWPRPFDPAHPIDVSGVPGVTTAQEQRATALIRSTLDNLPAFADVRSVGALGYRSIGDSSTGYEHYINSAYLRDGRFLDATRPESLVYRVDGTNRTLVSAMYIAESRIADPELVDYGGSLMQWHVHDNLCWSSGANGPRVAGITDAQGACPPGSINPGAGSPMVHVWITAHRCGPFAALEGHGAGQAATGPDGRRTDVCAHDHSGGHR
ncbi:hypothetical protein [Nocardia lijiangensis]|uniref:hypothetical protein n=1 Tax=Nocardia lijiangensis TaxID=299618 RepID=UPI003D75A762